MPTTKSQDSENAAAGKPPEDAMVYANSAKPPPGTGEILGGVVSSPASPTFFSTEFRLNAGKVTRPGTFVGIEAHPAQGGTSLVLARVNDVHEVNPHEDALSSTLRNVLPFGTKYASEGHSTVIYRIASAEPLEEALLDDDGHIVTVRAVETLPRAGAYVVEAGAELTAKALGLEQDPNAGLWVGASASDPNVQIVLSKSIIQRHIFIGGGIGSGKSYTRGVLAEELQAFGICQVNIDVNGEMIDATTELGGTNLIPGKGFTVPVSALSPSDVTAAVPSINPGTNMHTLLQFTHEYLLREVAEGKRDFFTVDDLVRQIDGCADTLEIKQKMTVEPTKLRTRSLNRLKFIGKPFDWAGALKPGAILNVNCKAMPINELRLVSASIARDLQNLARNGKIPFVALSIDEFHLVAPNDDNVVTTQVLREIARIGRHYKLALILTTQSPSDVDRAILKRLLTRFLHAIEPDQLDALKGVFSDASEDLVRSLPKLPQGTCIITGAFETVRHATVVKIRERITSHGGKTPDIWTDIGKAGWPSKRYAKVDGKGK